MVSQPTQGANGFMIRNSACTVSISCVFLSFSRIRVDARKRRESGYVWTRKVLSLQQNVCGYKRIQTRVDGASGKYLESWDLCHLNLSGVVRRRDFYMA